MAGTKEIKRHIKSVRDTAKVTNAMYLVSSSALHKARALLSASSAYSDAVSSLIQSLSAANQGSVYSRGHGDMTAVLLIASDKGLCGDYNKNVVNFALEEKKDRVFFIIGGKAKEHFTKCGIPFSSGFDFPSVLPNEKYAADITDKLNAIWLSGDFVRLEAVYTDTRSGLHPTLRRRQLLPVETDEDKAAPECLPSRGELFDKTVLLYLKAVITDVLANANAAEQYSRMFAMDAASKNAKKLESELQIQYYHSRQTQITNEILEITNANK